MSSTALSPRALLLALAVVMVWGSNFAIIGATLHSLPPLLFATLRFAAVVFPLIFFVRPAVHCHQRLYRRRPCQPDCAIAGRVHHRHGDADQR